MAAFPIACAVVAGLAGSIAAAQEARAVDVRFPAESDRTTISGRIEGNASMDYKVGAEAGQRMTVVLDPSNAATYFNIYSPGLGPGDEALVASQLTDPINRFEDALPASGVYTISVYMMRSAARRNEASDYTLEVSVTGELEDVVRGDYADGLQGGPDFWRVSTGGDALNLRSGPSAAAGVIASLPNQSDLRNFGCRIAEGRRWCRVATLEDPRRAGWAAGDFLVESGGGAAAPPAARAESSEAASE